MNSVRLLFFSFLVIIGVFHSSCTEHSDITSRDRISLHGTWQFALDTSMVGMTEEWFKDPLPDSIQLPGTTDSNQKGNLNRDTTTLHLNRQYRYEGVAWYRKSITIPESYEGKHIELFLERTKSSKVWIDNQPIGSSKLLQAPQIFDVTDYLTPGQHVVSIRIDNNLSLTPYGNVHIYSDDTQTNWNGIIGEMYLEASAKTRISDMQVFPDILKKQAKIKLALDNGLQLKEVTVELRMELINEGSTKKLPSKRVVTSIEDQISLTYDFTDVVLWDEFEQPLYNVTAVISSDKILDSKEVTFGMRDFKVAGTQFEINGQTTFLRGKHESAVFPKTGHTPMDVKEWRRVYRIAKEYGINHYRFHSYCPPDAAFVAADEEGIYLQAELPFWGGLESDSVAQMLRSEGCAMLDAYANHPSFVMFSPGNEIWGGHDQVAANMKALKAYDNRPLYTMGSNNNIGYLPPQDYAEFFVGARIPNRGDTTIGHTRLTHAFADSWRGGILNNHTPATQVNFNYAVDHMDLPIVSHEIGQYQIYPNYDEISKYTGNLKAWNLQVFQQRLAAKGMADLDSAFQKASGAWSALCYKAEMEAAIGTPGMGGFQLLDLQDFPGQGTALVGVLDAFMDSKGVVTVDSWKQSCDDVVILLKFPKYTWISSELFEAKISIANYSKKTLTDELNWKIADQSGDILKEGTLKNQKISNEGLVNLGSIKMDFSEINHAKKLTITVALGNSGYSNEYPIWVYPSSNPIEPTEELIVANRLSKDVLTQLKNGSSVLLFPNKESIKEKSFKGHFPPEFWNYGMFKGISEHVSKPVSPGTLGLLMNPDHPIFQDFPTDFHTNWQWFSIIKASNSLILDQTAGSYRPIVQVIDNLERNHKLGLIFEFQVGNGKLLVCMARLPELKGKPEAVQLYSSILDYMRSSEFKPEYSVTEEELLKLL